VDGVSGDLSAAKVDRPGFLEADQQDAYFAGQTSISPRPNRVPGLGDLRARRPATDSYSLAPGKRKRSPRRTRTRSSRPKQESERPPPTRPPSKQLRESRA